eukprot:CAMPEP_0184040432 /NCGR_PEP_ID=MMETSP0955-20130417/57933_1 /TAXON_ID=627963 /ORGANISM="Aplanochytrium sp, Strain PBS07" /LENGTH=210 /DNA_ID=CAMNT_0026330215 /DNA_START=156 /DNA_END=788 /DNA_ORIENTATION=-
MAILDDPPYIYVTGASVAWSRAVLAVTAIGAGELFLLMLWKEGWPTPLHILMEQSNGYFEGTKSKGRKREYRKAVNVLREAGQKAILPLQIPVEKVKQAIKERKRLNEKASSSAQKSNRSKYLPTIFKPRKNFAFDSAYVGSGRKDQKREKTGVSEIQTAVDKPSGSNIDTSGSGTVLESIGVNNGGKDTETERYHESAHQRLSQTNLMD